MVKFELSLSLIICYLVWDSNLISIFHNSRTLWIFDKFIKLLQFYSIIITTATQHEFNESFFLLQTLKLTRENSCMLVCQPVTSACGLVQPSHNTGKIRFANSTWGYFKLIVNSGSLNHLGMMNNNNKWQIKAINKMIIQCTTLGKIHLKNKREWKDWFTHSEDYQSLIVTPNSSN